MSGSQQASSCLPLLPEREEAEAIELLRASREEYKLEVVAATERYRRRTADLIDILASQPKYRWLTELTGNNVEPTVVRDDKPGPESVRGQEQKVAPDTNRFAFRTCSDLKDNNLLLP